MTDHDSKPFDQAEHDRVLEQCETPPEEFSRDHTEGQPGFGPDHGDPTATEVDYDELMASLDRHPLPRRYHVNVNAKRTDCAVRFAGWLAYDGHIVTLNGNQNAVDGQAVHRVERDSSPEEIEAARVYGSLFERFCLANNRLCSRLASRATTPCRLDSCLSR